MNKTLMVIEIKSNFGQDFDSPSFTFPFISDAS